MTHLCRQQSCEVDLGDHLISTLAVALAITVLRLHLLTND